MKKKQLKKLLYDQANEITRLQRENRYLKDKFSEAKDFLMASIVDIIGGGANVK